MKKIWDINKNKLSEINGSNDALVDYGSHFIPLTFAVLNTTGPVLEMGTGHFSTPLLHVLCMNDKRKILSTDTSLTWLKNFVELENEWHKFEYIPVYEDDWSLNPKPNIWDDLITFEEDWGIVFIDHRPGERRVKDILKFKDTAQIIVVHDSQELSYGYEEAFRKFKFRFDYKRFPTWTTLLSNSISFDNVVF